MPAESVATTTERAIVCQMPDLSAVSDTYTHIVKLAPTCSYPVDSAEMAPGNQHLNWQFAFYPLPWLPGAYAFFLTMFLPMVFYRPWQRSTAMAVWLAFTFVGPYLINPMSAMSLF